MTLRDKIRQAVQSGKDCDYQYDHVVGEEMMVETFNVDRAVRAIIEVLVEEKLIKVDEGIHPT